MYKKFGARIAQCGKLSRKPPYARCGGYHRASPEVKHNRQQTPICSFALDASWRYFVVCRAVAFGSHIVFDRSTPNTHFTHIHPVSTRDRADMVPAMLPSPALNSRHQMLWAIVALASVASGGSLRAAGWVDARRLGPLVVRADFILDPQGRIWQDLNGLQTDVTQILGLPAVGAPIEIYLLRDEARYADYLRRYLPNVPYRRAIYVKGTGAGQVFAFLGPNLEIDLRHECTHALLHASLPDVPIWLDEGLAQFFEVDRALRVQGHPQLAAVQQALSGNGIADVSTLESKARITDMGAGEYRDSWAWVHFMLLGPEPAQAALKSYFADVAQHRAATPL